MKPTGLIYIFTGDGKGKTSAALGVMVRAVCAGLKVGWVAWYKEEQWPINEKRLPQLLPMDFFLLGKGFHLKKAKYQTENAILKKKIASLKSGGVVIDHAHEDEHKQAAVAALQKAAELLDSQNYDVVICDEINNALADGLLTIMQVKALLEKRGKTHLILTGRDVHAEIATEADLVTEMRKIKHPYDSGIKAVKGLDF